MMADFEEWLWKKVVGGRKQRDKVWCAWRWGAKYR